MCRVELGLVDGDRISDSCIARCPHSQILANSPLTPTKQTSCQPSEARTALTYPPSPKEQAASRRATCSASCARAL